MISTLFLTFSFFQTLRENHSAAERQELEQMTVKYRTLKKKVVHNNIMKELFSFKPVAGQPRMNVAFFVFLQTSTQVKARDVRMHQHYRGELNTLRESFHKIFKQYKERMELAYETREKGVRKKRPFILSHNTSCQSLTQDCLF